MQSVSSIKKILDDIHWHENASLVWLPEKLWYQFSSWRKQVVARKFHCRAMFFARLWFTLSLIGNYIHILLVANTIIFPFDCLNRSMHSHKMLLHFILQKSMFTSTQNYDFLLQMPLLFIVSSASLPLPQTIFFHIWEESALLPSFSLFLSPTMFIVKYNLTATCFTVKSFCVQF